jgi:integrase
MVVNPEMKSTTKKYHDYDRDAFRIAPYQDKKRPHLKYAVHCKVGGKWVRRFFKTEREAKTYVDLRRIALRNEGEQGLILPAEIRVAALRAHEQLGPFGKTIDDAVGFFLRHLQTERASISVRQAVDELIANRRDAGLSQRYCGDLQIRLRRFVNSFGDRSVASITAKDIDSWLESLGVGPVTRNTFRRDVRTLFSFCYKRNYCAENPATAAIRAKEPSREVEVLSVDQAKKLLASSSPEMLPYWAVGMFAGLRPSEIRQLEWTDVDFEDALITVRSTKTGRKRFVKMQPNLISWLTFHRRRDGKVVSPINFRKQEEQDKTAAGLGDDWPQNALRHSFGSYWLAQFNDINALALLMGNSPAVIERHYKRAVRPKEAHRYWALTPEMVHEGGKVVAAIARVSA